MTDELSVVHVITALTTGGAERQVESIVKYSRHRQHVITLYGGGTVADTMIAAGYRVEVLNLSGLRRVLALPVLTTRLRHLRPDAVQVHLLAGQLWGLPAARLARVPVRISTEHSLNAESIESLPLTTSLRRIYMLLNRLATTTVAVSAATAARLECWGVPPERVTVIDNGIDFDALAFDPAGRAAVRSELGIAQDAEVIGAVGRLEPVKRFEQLLDAVAGTLVRGRRELVIAGAGPLERTLRDRAAVLGVQDRVHLIGARPDIPAVLASMDVLVSPSRDETFGMAVIEAIGAGLPVLYAECPALDDLGGSFAGTFRIDVSDDAAEAASIASGVEQALLRADGHRLRVQQTIRDRYDILATTARLDALVDGGRVRRLPARSH